MLMSKEKILAALTPVANAFMGMRPAPYTRPEFQQYPLTEMLSRLLAIADVDWYHYAFSREPLNGRFSDEQRRCWMEESLACGKEYARRLTREYQTNDPKTLARKLNIKVHYPTYPEKTDRVLFGEYKEPGNVFIYMDAVNKANELLKDGAVRGLLTNKFKAADVLLAHEIFHHAERLFKSEIYTMTTKIRLWSLGPLHNDSLIYALGEIAAMGFAKELMGLSWLPFLMDVLLVYGYSKNEAYGLYEEMISYVKDKADGMTGKTKGNSEECFLQI